MIDTHCHLNIEDFNDDFDQVIQDAINSGVSKILVVGIDSKTNQKAIELALKYPEIYASVGIHPSAADDESTDGLEPLLSHPKVIAIGECGIDLYWRDDNLEKQKACFIKQIELSIKYRLPLIIHTRDSFEQTYQCIEPYNGKVFGVFHCFTSNLENANRAIDLGFYIGVDGPVTFKNAKEVKQIVKEIPLERILLETDSPYLSPHPFRGKRNEPKRLIHIAQAIADIKNISLEAVIKQTTINATRVFQLGEEKYEN